jgi:hypothetical protein
MPWCETCSKFWNPPSMTEAGACPTCGRVLVQPDGTPTDTVDARTVDVKALAGEEGKAPWHFKLLVGATALYLGWRLVQLVIWIVK